MIDPTSRPLSRRALTTIGLAGAIALPALGSSCAATTNDGDDGTHSLDASTPGASLATSFEPGQTQPTYRDAVDWSTNVTGYDSNLKPECSTRQEEAHTGKSALMYSGTDDSTTQSYVYFKSFDVNIAVTASTVLTYWIRPDQAAGSYVGVDLEFTDGSELRDSAARDQNGCSLHPHDGHCGHAPAQSWSEITSKIGVVLAGKTVRRVWVAYDHAAGTGQFRGYIDDLSITSSSGGGSGGATGTGGSSAGAAGEAGGAGAAGNAGGGGSGGSTGPTLPGSCSGGSCTECTVDFGSDLRALSPEAVGTTISTYGNTVAKSSTQKSELQKLGANVYRVPIQWNGGTPKSSASGSGEPADPIVDAIRSIGGTVALVIGGTSDNNFSASDAANLVKHFAPKGVSFYLLGNEPNNGGMSINTYVSNVYNPAVTAMREADPSIRVGGPTWADYDLGALHYFIDNATDFDVVDFHNYAMGGSALGDSTALAQTQQYEDQIAAVYAYLQQKGKTGKQVTVGEYNFSWQFNDGYSASGETRLYKPITTVWAASALGHGLKSGGWMFQYADQNGPLGVTTEPNNEPNIPMSEADNSPMPIYHGLGMWTGEGLFRRYGGEMVAASCGGAGLEAFATSGPSVMLINKNTSAQAVAVSLANTSATAADVWQTGANAFAAPTKVASGSLASGKQLALTLPAMTVTTVVLR